MVYQTRWTSVGRLVPMLARQSHMSKEVVVEPLERSTFIQGGVSCMRNKSSIAEQFR
jgi:hypothetical protein